MGFEIIDENEEEYMKNIEVVAAVIKKDNAIFATQRGHGDYKGWWEFPGGKIEEGESLEEALKREIREELSIEVEVGQLIHVVEYDYSKFHLKMYCFFCKIQGGKITLIEHDDGKWLKKEELGSIKWLEADIEVIDKLKQIM